MPTDKQTRAVLHDHESRWALRMVHPAAPEAALGATATNWVPEAIEELISMFDLAVEQANATLSLLGAPQQIVGEQLGDERRFTYTAADGTERRISIVLTVPRAGGQGQGSAYLSTSESRAFIYLVPAQERGRVGWGSAGADLPFTVDTVHDLFLSVFADDPASTLRLSPLGGHGLFQLPWG